MNKEKVYMHPIQMCGVYASELFPKYIAQGSWTRRVPCQKKVGLTLGSSVTQPVRFGPTTRTQRNDVICGRRDSRLKEGVIGAVLAKDFLKAHIGATVSFIITSEPKEGLYVLIAMIEGAVLLMSRSMSARTAWTISGLSGSTARTLVTGDKVNMEPYGALIASPI